MRSWEPVAQFWIRERQFQDYGRRRNTPFCAAGSLTAAVAAALRAAGSRKVEVDVEVETMEEFEEALRAGPDIIMLDEFSLADMSAAVALNNSRGHGVRVEASGSVTRGTVRSVAETGVDYISIGGITKHVRAVELSMRLAFAS
jgi:nicotinate-nucleotide pyrophosphorylase (carboxylating)